MIAGRRAGHSHWLLVFAGGILVLLGLLWEEVLTHQEGHYHPWARPAAQGPAVANTRGRTRILVLNSYHFGYSWSDNEMSGILETLHRLAPSVDPVVECLDCKRFPDMGHFPQLQNLFRRKYTTQGIPLVIAADNPAFEFALGRRQDLFPDVPIVFCGINGYDPGRIASLTGVTGVAEILDAAGTLDLALRLHPGTREVVIFHDHSLTGMSSRREVEEQLRPWAGKVHLRFLEPMPLRDLLRTLERLTPGTIVLALSYSMDRNGAILDHDRVAELLAQHCPVPVYSMHEERVGHGVVGGHVMGGYSQGRRAAELAVEILKGAAPASLPVDRTGPSSWQFDFLQLQRFGLSPSRLPAGSIVLNQPSSFFDEHRGLVLTTFALLSMITLGVLVLMLNVTRRQLAEEAQEVSEHRFRRLFETAVDLILVLGPDGRVIQANPRAGEILGIDPAALAGRFLGDLLPAGTSPAVMARINETPALGRVILETTFPGPAGNGTPVELICSPLAVETGPAILCTARDLTERRRAETRQRKLQDDLNQAQKMESIGFLAGGIAHDFNNILTSILGYAELANKQLPEGSPGHRFLASIKTAGEKAALLTRQLLAFSRKQALQVRALDLREVIQGMAGILKRLLREDIDLQVREGNPVPPVLADRSQVEQILMNLVVNARDAMPDGGKVFIEIGTAVITDPLVRHHQFERTGEFVVMAVSDTGVGIPPQIRGRIFEPFFTTKEVGKGTGLGLATVYGIVKQHAGHIYFYSEVGQGTTFKIYLPVALETAVADAAAPAAAPPLPASAGAATGAPNQETILVVDDDPALAELVRDTLAPLGYTLLVTSSATEAMEIGVRHPGPIHVLLTDVIMPGINGRKLAEAVRAARPEVKVVFMSGYSDDIIAYHGILDPGVELVHKPISPTELAGRLRTILDRRSGGGPA
ncbi:MAG: response regulator [Candidatus Riflebacteria bacterium]|nr:response regulator [Candidatus Riflebacteria bacterium]